MRVIFAGTPSFSVPVLNALLASDHEVCAVLTQPDRPKGRGRKLAVSPIKEAALQLELPIYQPKSLRDVAIQTKLQAMQADVMVVVAYGLLLPEAVLSLPMHGCLNVHASLLPKYRGASPIQAAILQGDKETGVTIMRMDKGLDTGDMLLKRYCAIEPDDTAQVLHDKLASLGAEAIVDALAQIANGTALFEKQHDEEATYAPKITKEDARIDWTQPATDIANQIRAYNPWPIAHAMLGHTTVRIWCATPLSCFSQSSAKPGQLLEVSKSRLIVACGEGALQIDIVQLPGGKALPIQACLNAKRELFIEGESFNS